MQVASAVLSLLSFTLLGTYYAVPVADATCQVRLRYTGPLSNPTWDPETPLTNNICEGTCPVSGACKLSSKVISESQTDYWCECPSGGGDGGCRGTIVKLINHAGFTLKLVCTDGGCDAGQTCDWSGAAVPPNETGTWAKCKCQ